MQSVGGLQSLYETVWDLKLLEQLLQTCQGLDILGHGGPKREEVKGKWTLNPIAGNECEDLRL